MADVPVSAYAGTFVLVNASYIALCHEAMAKTADSHTSSPARNMMYLRSFLTLAIFVLSGILALWHPYLGFGLVVCCLLSYLRPDTWV